MQEEIAGYREVEGEGPGTQTLVAGVRAGVRGLKMTEGICW